MSRRCIAWGSLLVMDFVPSPAKAFTWLVAPTPPAGIAASQDYVIRWLWTQLVCCFVPLPPPDSKDACPRPCNCSEGHMVLRRGRNDPVWAYQSKRGGHSEIFPDGRKLFPDKANYPLRQDRWSLVCSVLLSGSWPYVESWHVGTEAISPINHLEPLANCARSSMTAGLNSTTPGNGQHELASSSFMPSDPHQESPKTHWPHGKFWRFLDGFLSRRLPAYGSRRIQGWAWLRRYSLDSAVCGRPVDIELCEFFGSCWPFSRRLQPKGHSLFGNAVAERVTAIFEHSLLGRGSWIQVFDFLRQTELWVS